VNLIFIIAQQHENATLDYSLTTVYIEK